MPYKKKEEAFANKEKQLKELLQQEQEAGTKLKELATKKKEVFIDI